MTEPDYVWLANDNLPGNPIIRIEDGSQWHYAQGGWVETDPVPELTAADIEAAEEEPKPYVHDVLVLSTEPAPELADNEQEPDPETPAQEES